MKNGELYYAVDGDYKLLGKISEITSNITDVVKPTEEFTKKIKFNQEFSMSFNISNVDKDVLIKNFIEPYIQYEFQRELFILYLKNYRHERMKAKGMTDREIVIEEIYQKHKWGFL